MLEQKYILENLAWVTLKNPEDFLKVKETLTRIGIASKKDRTLYQSCHILHKQGRYAIVHFKELFALDGRETDLNENDIQRRNTICSLLDQWGLLTVVDGALFDNVLDSLNQLKIVPFKEKHDWNLVAKYTIGRKSSS